MQTFSHKNLKSWLMLRSFGMAIIAAVLMTVFAPSSALSQTLNDRIAARQKTGDRSKMLVDAREVVYDRDKDRVSAVGDVQIYYQGRVLEADRVTYDRKAKRVYAEGNARLTESDGTKSYGDRFDLTDDFKDGFVDSLRVETPTKQRLSAARAERTSGEVTVLERGTYTACEPCKDKPEKPPLWQVKAARIIHNNSEQRIYYENATLEFWGVPVAYMPFFSSPDPSVTRASGILAPRYFSNTTLGRGFGVPIYWAIAQNYDVTFTPTYLSRQGLLGDVLWRHRMENGSYNIRATGIFQQDKGAFLPPPDGTNSREFRGSIITKGKFYLNEKWNAGWDVTILSDKFFLSNYKLKSISLSNSYFPEVTSTVYLNGKGERSWFDLRGYHFQGTSAKDWQPQSPTVLPVFDFNRKFTPNVIGGDLDITLNMTALNREAADFQARPPGAGGVFYPDYKIADSRGRTTTCFYLGAGGAVSGAYNPANCLLRGMAGQYTRATANAEWRRTFIDPIGQSWTPFIGMRADAAAYRLNVSDYNGVIAGDPYGNNQQANFLGNSNDGLVRAMPSVGVEYRYPFFALTNWGTHQFEPIAQFVMRPAERRIGKLPNEDAQSFIFDTTTLFSWNKFSGYDRIEGGTRLNYGAQYTFNAHNGALMNVLFGQSLHVAGRNSFATADVMNTSLNSGLESRRSDYVASVTIQPNAETAFITRGRFDEKNFELKRLDAEARMTFGRVSASAQYTRIAPQPEIGENLRREGVSLTSHVKLPNNFYVKGGVLLDLDRYLTSRQAVAAAIPGARLKDNLVSLAGSTLSVGYKDECTDLSLTYLRSSADSTSGTTKMATTVMLRLELKSLGETSTSKKFND